METAIFRAPRTIDVATEETPSPGPGQVLVAIEGCGLCGSNLPVYEGRPWFGYPLASGVPGHEGWGRIAALGQGVRGLVEGTRVAYIGASSYATHEVVPASALVVLPSALEESPFPGEPLGCAMNAFERSDVHAGQKVAVVGVGFLGALLVQLAARAGAEVIAVSRRSFALEVGRESGAAHVFGLEDPGAARDGVLELTGGRGCDRVIEAVGLQQSLDLASELTRVRGRLVIAGYHQDGKRQVDMQQWNWRGLDVVNAHERDEEVYRRGVERAVGAVLEGRLRLEPLLTHSFPLRRIGEAFETALARPAGFLKAWIDMGGGL